MGRLDVISYCRTAYISKTLKESNEKQGYVRFVSGFCFVSKRCESVFTIIGACYFQDFLQTNTPWRKTEILIANQRVHQLICCQSKEPQNKKYEQQFNGSFSPFKN